MYALFIDLDPAQVDVNVHPTKQEIKFEDEKIVYAFVQSAVKHALAQFSVTPLWILTLTLLSSSSRRFNNHLPTKNQRQFQLRYTKDLLKRTRHILLNRQKSELKHWKDFYEERIPITEAGSPNIGLKIGKRVRCRDTSHSPLTTRHSRH